MATAESGDQALEQRPSRSLTGVGGHGLMDSPMGPSTMDNIELVDGGRIEQLAAMGRDALRQYGDGSPRS